MEIWIATFLVFLVVIGAMSVGVLMGREPIKGSCGGVGKALGEEDYICPVCGDDPDKCVDEEKNNKASDSDKQVLAYELKGK